jgi:hypothetical protein
MFLHSLSFIASPAIGRLREGCCLVDKGRRKRTADVAEKLGVGLLLGAVAQGIFVQEPSLRTYVAGAVAVTVAMILIVVSIALSQED